MLGKVRQPRRREKQRFELPRAIEPTGLALLRQVRGVVNMTAVTAVAAT
jgi:hypothetical protein